MIKLTLPLPPSLNRSHMRKKQPNKSRFGTLYHKRIRTNETKTYMKNIQWEESAKHFSNEGILPLFNAGVKLYLDLWFYYPDKRRRDAHNALKILLDTLQGIYYEDDFWVLPRIQDFQVDKKNPRVEIEIREKE